MSIKGDGGVDRRTRQVPKSHFKASFFALNQIQNDDNTQLVEQICGQMQEIH